MRSPCLSLPSPRTCLHANIFQCLIKYFLQAQPKHLSCIAVSSFHLACSQLEDQLLAIPEPADLVSISQSRCSASDLLRMEAILAKQHLLTGYLEALLNTRLAGKLKIITPFDPEQRGCQLSLVFNCDLNQVKSRYVNLVGKVIT